MSDDIRVGVFLCQCGGQISNVLSNSRIERAIKKISDVAFVSIADFPCSKMGLRQLQSAIGEHQLNRVVIAGCSPRLMKNVFSKAVSEAELNPNLIEIANIRDHCARVHQKQRSLATSKAIEMITAAIHKVAQKQPLEKLQQKMTPVVAVIGGGIAGMSAALSLANRGAKVKLIEKEAQLGGLLHLINLLYPRDISASEFLKEKVREINDHPNIEVILGAEVTQITGAVGNYNIRYLKDATETKLQAGAIIFSGGAQYFYPHGLYQYGKNERVITQLEFERMLMQNKLTAKELVFIQCVGSRNEERPYCARFCCPTTFKNVLWLKKANPDLKITVIFRGLTEYIREYDEATELGVLFVRYDPKQPPEVQNNYVYVKDEKTEKEFEIPFDLLVLATPLIPKPEARTWSQMLHLPIDEYGFLV
ncbi:MAG: FAD-dependent oxidoreductase, partial [candidate division KSB1 bacterium]|nr:FAD-dependent oxidoreductase [candidate division KSB1 bacterium]